MSTEVEICNSAMIKVGAELISSLSDNTKEARLCNHQYPRIVNAVLRAAPWTFALRRASLTPAVVTLEYGDENVFQLPADCLRVCRVNDHDTPYKIMGRTILADTDVIEMEYVTSAVSVNDFDACFEEAVSNAIAADLAYPLTQSQSLSQTLFQTADFWINQARSISSQEQTPENFNFDGFLNSRMGGEV